MLVKALLGRQRCHVAATQKTASPPSPETLRWLDRLMVDAKRFDHHAISVIHDKGRVIFRRGEFDRSRLYPLRRHQFLAVMGSAVARF